MRVWSRFYPQRPALTEEDYALYHELLIDIGGVEALDEACRKASQVCRFFPVPADILAQAEKKQVVATRNTAESEWQHLLNRCNFGAGPKLSEAAKYAVKCAGGLGVVSTCSTDDLVWRKKEFLEAYNRWTATPQDQRALTVGESKKLLAEASARAEGVDKLNPGGGR